MDSGRAEETQASPYFAGRAEQLIGQVVGRMDASAGHPAEAGDGGRAEARIAALEDRLADVERRLAALEADEGRPGR